MLEDPAGNVTTRKRPNTITPETKLATVAMPAAPAGFAKKT
ncbi:MAG: hypothetical protein ACREC9_05245 [Methylocella sp.]